MGSLSQAQSCLQKRLVSGLPSTCGRTRAASDLWAAQPQHGCGACGLSAAEGAVAHRRVLVVVEELRVPRRHPLIGDSGRHGRCGGARGSS